MRSSESKIVSREKLKSLVADHKKRGQPVVFTNGCFDILHVGHVRYLEAARQEGSSRYSVETWLATSYLPARGINNSAGGLIPYIAAKLF